MTALAMRLKLERLRRHHGHQLQPVTVPLAQPTARAQVLTGRASTTDVDLQRQRFRGWAFGAIHRQPYPLLYFKHDTGRGEVGTITNLEYDSGGNLIITATVTCPLARRANAFSIGCTVRDFEILDAASPDDFHALIRRAELTEISLTDTPANPQARVTARRDVSAQAEFYEHAAAATRRISQVVKLLGAQNGYAIG